MGSTTPGPDGLLREGIGTAIIGGMDPIRIANCSGFFGDRRTAAREMVEGGAIDVLTGDYLAELTMAILARHRIQRGSPGYVPTFLDHLGDVIDECLRRGIRIVTNAGGLDPHALASAVEELAGGLGLEVSVATVTGDDVLAEAGSLRHAVTGETMVDRGVTPVTANAYLGGWGIAEALTRGAHVVVTGRVADASLVVGPAAWRFGWTPADLDQLAGAVVAGHVIECGAQATGGNYSFFGEVADLAHVGFPLVEVADDGSSVITKHPGTGGLVDVGTVTAQLLYEVAGPRYLNPDVVARLDTVRLTPDGPDRVRIEGVRGEPAPSTTKVAATALSGYRNSVTFLVAGLDVPAKAAVAEEALWERLGGRDRFALAEVRLMRTDQADPPSHEAAFAQLKVTVFDADPEKVGRAFSNAAVELALASYPGFLLAAPPGKESPNVVYWPATLPQRTSVVTLNGATFEAPPSPPNVTGGYRGEPVDIASDFDEKGPTQRAPIGCIIGARSGDKGGDANLGVWARDEVGFAWLVRFLTVDRLRSLIPEAAPLHIDRHILPAVRAVNFVLFGYLGEGAASSTSMDPQAKALGEYLRARVVEVPRELVPS